MCGDKVDHGSACGAFASRRVVTAPCLGSRRKLLSVIDATLHEGCLHNCGKIQACRKKSLIQVSQDHADDETGDKKCPACGILCEKDEAYIHCTHLECSVRGQLSGGVALGGQGGVSPIAATLFSTAATSNYNHGSF